MIIDDFEFSEDNLKKFSDLRNRLEDKIYYYLKKTLSGQFSLDDFRLYFEDSCVRVGITFRRPGCGIECKTVELKEIL